MPISRFVLRTAAVAIAASAPFAVRAQTPVKIADAPLSLSVPAGYRLITRKDPIAKAHHESPDWVFDCLGAPVNGFNSNFNLMTHAAQPGVTFGASAAPRLGAEMKKQFPASTNITTGALTVGGEKATYVSAILAIQNHNVHTKVVQFVHAGMRYTLTFTSDASVFDKQVGTFDKAVASIKWA